MNTNAEHTISNIAISQAQREVEQTPSDPFLAPRAGGSYYVDESVIAGGKRHLERLSSCG